VLVSDVATSEEKRGPSYSLRPPQASLAFLVTLMVMVDFLTTSKMY
jgi:hypothetical protein